MKSAVAPAPSSLTDFMISSISNDLYESTHTLLPTSSLAPTEVLGYEVVISNLNEREKLRRDQITSVRMSVSDNVNWLTWNQY